MLLSIQDLEMLKLLLENGANVNEKMQMNGWSDLNINIHKLMVQKDFIVFRFIYFKVSEVTVL